MTGGDTVLRLLDPQQTLVRGAACFERSLVYNRIIYVPLQTAVVFVGHLQPDWHAEAAVASTSNSTVKFIAKRKLETEWIFGAWGRSKDEEWDERMMGLMVRGRTRWATCWRQGIFPRRRQKESRYLETFSLLSNWRLEWRFEEDRVEENVFIHN